MRHISSEQKRMDVSMFKFPMKNVYANPIAATHVAYPIVLVHVTILNIWFITGFS